MKRKIEIGSALLAVAGVLLAIRPLKGDINESIAVLPDRFFTACLVLGVCLAVAGVVVFLLPSKIPEFDGDFDLRRAKRSELQFVHDFSKEEIGGEVSPLDQMHHWYNKNRDIFWILVYRKAGKWRSVNKKVGYYSIMPLTESARRLVEREELNGLKFTTEHMMRKDEKPAAIYIGGIAAKRLPFRSRAVLLTYLKEHMKRERDRGVTTVYSRPVNKNGLRTLLRNGFSPAADLGHDDLNRIYKTVIPDDN
jgi:hypothetical protein